MGMLRSYSTEENSGNRSRQLLKEVRPRSWVVWSVFSQLLKEVRSPSWIVPLVFGDQIGLNCQTNDNDKMCNCLTD